MQPHRTDERQVYGVEGGGGGGGNGRHETSVMIPMETKLITVMKSKGHLTEICSADRMNEKLRS